MSYFRKKDRHHITNPVYYHRDGNGVHLKLYNFYVVERDNTKLVVKVIGEYANYYLVRVEDKYNSTINKFINEDIRIIKNLT